jgi:serine/threonine protein kinase/tetratricopeptide (TPR) repeat protein
MTDDPIDHLRGHETIKMSEDQSPDPSGQILPIGTLLDNRYLILRELGRGGFSCVFLASDEKVMSKKVVVKVLQETEVRNAWIVQKSRQEIEALSRIDHPSVVGVFDFGELPSGSPYIVMKYVDGVTLRSCIAPEGMDLQRVARLIKLLGSALASAHQKGILHRDLKPENVMLQMLSGADEQPTIIDFGVAKVKNSLIAPSTAEPRTLGTYLYMSPEQFRGEPVTTASDIYSLGVIAYEMITGRRPFNPETVARLAEMHREGVKIKPKDLRPALPDRAQGLILQALSLAASDRPNDARKFAEALDVTLTQLDAPESEQENSRKREPAKNERFSSKLLVGAVASLLLIAVVAAMVWSKFSSTSKVVVESVAVLPFNFEQANADAEYISGGITDSLIDELSRMPSMKKVIAHASVARYRGQLVDPINVGRELDVQAVLLGEITQQGDLLTVSAELVSTLDKRHIWGTTRSFRLTDLLANQIEISRNIVVSLQQRLTDGESRTNAYPQDNTAYLLYLKGRDYWSKRDVYRAAECFHQAIDKDPRFALAYSGLADSYSLMDDRPPNETMPEGKAAAIKALELDNTLAEAHTSLAFVLFRYDWNWSGAEAEVKRAIELNPNYGTAHQLYALYLMATQRPDEALKEIKRAQELDPLSIAMRKNLGSYFLFTRQYDKALEEYQKVLEIDSKAPVHGYLGLAYQQKGMFDQAFQETQKMLAPKLSAEQMEQLRQAYATSGYKGVVTTEISLLKERSKGQYESPAELARLCAMIGQKDEAFDWLNKAYEARADALIYIKVDPRYDNLRADPRFSDLLKRVGLANN